MGKQVKFMKDWEKTLYVSYRIELMNKHEYEVLLENELFCELKEKTFNLFSKNYGVSIDKIEGSIVEIRFQMDSSLDNFTPKVNPNAIIGEDYLNGLCILLKKEIESVKNICFVVDKDLQDYIELSISY